MKDGGRVDCSVAWKRRRRDRTKPISNTTISRLTNKTVLAWRNEIESEKEEWGEEYWTMRWGVWWMLRREGKLWWSLNLYPMLSLLFSISWNTAVIFVFNLSLFILFYFPFILYEYEIYVLFVFLLDLCVLVNSLWYCYCVSKYPNSIKTYIRILLILDFWQISIIFNDIFSSILTNLITWYFIHFSWTMQLRHFRLKACLVSRHLHMWLLAFSQIGIDVVVWVPLSCFRQCLWSPCLFSNNYQLD